MSGIYTMIVDKTQEQMMFATGNILRDVERHQNLWKTTQYSMEMKRERKEVN